MEMCARCKKRPATVYIMKIENNEQKQEGLCLVCARELGIKPVDDIMKRMGITDDELENMEKMVAEMMPADEENGENDENDDSPTIDFSKLMRNSGFARPGTEKEKKNTVQN